MRMRKPVHKWWIGFPWILPGEIGPFFFLIIVHIAVSATQSPRDEEKIWAVKNMPKNKGKVLEAPSIPGSCPAVSDYFSLYTQWKRDTVE